MKALFLEFSVDGHRGGEIYHRRLHQFLKKHFDSLVPETLPPLPASADSAWKRIQHAKQVCHQEKPELIISDISSASRNILAIRHTLEQGGRLLLIAQSVPSSTFVRGWIRRKITSWCEQYLIKHADIVICNSHFTSEALGGTGLDQQVRIIAAPGLEVAPSSQADLSCRWAQRPFRLLFVGECSRVKGLIYLVRALQQLKEMDILLEVVGGSRQEPFYYRLVQEVIAKSGLADRVRFSGFVDRAALNEKYRAASALVVPSLVEGYGMVAAEALAFGLPIIASNAGALPELISDDENGLLVSPADPDALAGAIGRLYEDESLYRWLSGAALESSKKLPTWGDFERVLSDKLVHSALERLFPS